MMPKVTIGLCVKNNAATIRDAIESIITQEYPHELMEVILVDGYSQDRTVSIAEKLLSGSDIKARIFFEDKGLGFARQVVVDNAVGDYIIWVDGDMILPKDFVKKQVEFMEKNPKVGIASAKHGIIAGINIIEALENVPFVVYDSKNGLLNSKLPGTGGSIYRIEAIRQSGGFDEKITGTGEDQDAAFRIRNLGWLIKRSPAIFYERRSRTWRMVWKKWMWYGFGDYDLYCKNRGIFSLFKMNPLAGFVNGLLHIAHAYKLTRYKFVFLLPFHMSLELTAWCLGFIKKQINR
jgi:glycosyltransferase involved in cell wall biosynthesis